MQRPRRKQLLSFLRLSLVVCVGSLSFSLTAARVVTRTDTFYLVQPGSEHHENRRRKTAEAKPNTAAIPYIIDGSPVPQGAFPFFVNSYSDKSLCGGTLIHQDVILTSAHCHGAFNEGLLLGGGDRKQSMADVVNAEKYRRINLQRPHPRFSESPDLINDDIMLLRLEEPVTMVTPVALNADPTIPANDRALLAIGYGRTEYDINAPGSTELLQAELNALSPEACAARLSSFDNIIVKDDVLCASNTQTNTSICQGDSGGPLLLVNELLLQVVQVGITSFTEECSANPVPNGFTRISTFYDWIQEQICDISAYPPTTGCPTKPNITVPAEGAVPIEIVFTHDSDPDETTWSIRDRRDGKVVFAGPEYVAQPGDQWTTVLFLPLGPYFMDVFDSAGDGLGWPAGIVIKTAVTEEYPNSRILMEERPGGSFVGTSIRFPFVVVDPGAPTLAPSAAPSMVILPTVSPVPTSTPTLAPTDHPTITPYPTDRPTIFPTVTLTTAPTELPTPSPPTEAPSIAPSFMPSRAPSPAPSLSAAPTTTTAAPTTSAQPSVTPSVGTTPFPTNVPSRAVEPAAERTTEPATLPETTSDGSSFSIKLTIVIGSSLWFLLLRS